LSKSKIRLNQVSLEYTNGRKHGWRFWNKKECDSNDGSRTVLEDINLEINAGEFVSILGHSGCGKSTLLKLIAGFVKPTRGEVWIDDTPVTGPRGDHVFVFQEGALFPWLTILKNVLLALNSVANPSERLDKARHYLELVSLEAYEDYYPHMLSGGMRQRAEIARALAAQPSVLLVDEPFSGLDYLTRLQMREEILYLHMMLSQTTIIFVTHDIDEALQLSNRVVIMSERPAKIKCCHSIGVPHPRVLTSPDLNDLRSRIYHHLGVHTAL
jgi:ABC-type nitrate/sulfonate/bicarbonate transport system ATPase subunit